MLSLYITFTFTNTFFIVFYNKLIIKNLSIGCLGLKNKKKLQLTYIPKLMDLLITTIQASKQNSISVYIKGFNITRDSILTNFCIYCSKSKIIISSLIDKTHIPYNGCKKSRAKRY